MRILASFATHNLKKWNVPILAVAAAVLMAICGASTMAQSGAGSIQGTVTDSTGAVMPGALIHVVNAGTNVATDTKSNGVGFYQVPSLFTGAYSVTVTAAGMKTYKTSIELQAGQNAAINPVLTAGSVTQQIEVAADAIQLTTTDNGAISSTLENARINQLPMNGRNVITLASQTTPGLESCSQSSSCPNGLMGQAMEYVADGASLNNREFGGTHVGSSQMPDPDSVQEVRVETTGAGAQYATPATGILTTKSGTNHIHGTLFETARNNAVGIARSRANPSSFVAPPYIRNEFGASGGGPVIIPHLYNGKDKSFWFYAYERYSLRSYSYTNMKVPTLAMRQGDFSDLHNASGVLQTLYDPSTTQNSSACLQPDGTSPSNAYCRTAFPGNMIPIDRLSPVAKVFNDITPLPTNNSINPLVTNNLNGLAPNITTIPTMTLRLDHAFNENNRAYLRYTNTATTTLSDRNSPATALGTLAADGLPKYASNITFNTDNLFAAAIGYTHVFSSTFYSETVVSQNWFTEQNSSGGTPHANYEKQLGLPNNFSQGGFPIINSIISPMSGTQFLYGMDQIISTADENLTKTMGKHQLMFGGRYRHERFGSKPDMVKDSISFNANSTGLIDPSTIAGKKYTRLGNTGYADADEFIGSPYTYSVNIQPPYQHLHDMEFDAYIQDNYRVTRNLTLNLGVRYEGHPAIWEKFGLMESFDLKNHAIVTAAPPATLIAEGYTTQAVITNDQNIGVKFETPQEAGMPANSLTNDSNLTFGPRVGLAWQPFGKWGTVVRGSYGRYIYPEPIRNTLVTVGRTNPLTVGYSTNYTSATYCSDAIINCDLRQPRTVVMGVNSSNVVNSSTTTSIQPGISAININPDNPPTYVTQTNFTIEQPMKGNSALRVSYIYTHGTNLSQSYFYNAHPSSYSWEMVNGTVPPSGTAFLSNQNGSTATGPYDQITYGGGNDQIQRSGWSNDNILQANYQRLFHHGIAYQVSYSWSKPFRVGGNSTRDSGIDPIQNYAVSGLGVMTPYVGTGATAGTVKVIAPATPPPPPAGAASYAYYKALNRFTNYLVDTAVPLQHIQFNGIIELPIGRGKRLLGNSNRLLDELVGGYQIAGAGSISSQDFTINNTNWSPTNPLKVYKHKVPITDCRSGSCLKEYLWWNGYIAPTSISGNACSAGLTNVVSGLPSDYAAYQGPADQLCSAPTVQKGVLAPTVDKYYGSNYVNVTTLDGKTTATNYQPYPTANTTGIGSNPFSHSVLNGPMFWTADISLFKVFPITEKTNLRFNVDAFNAFNVQGFNNPSDTDGTEQMTSSNNTPRQVQFTLRLTF